MTHGERIGARYRIGRVIGRGGMGVVYEGHDERIDRRVAIKVLIATASSVEQEARLRHRFEREAQAVGRAGSRHVVDIYDVGVLPNGDSFMVLEYLEGENLKQRLDRLVALPPRECAIIACELLEGLRQVHEVGIIHRDLKPANVFLARQPSGVETVKILDFGVCKLHGSPGEATGLDAVLGTVPYMAPEFVENGPRNLDARADLYGVGVLLYRCSSGRLPYTTRNLLQLRIQMRQHQPPALDEFMPDVDATFARIVERAMEWDPAARFPSAAEFRGALLKWLEAQDRMNVLLGDFVGPGPRSRRPPDGTRTPSSHPTRWDASVSEETVDLTGEPDDERK